MQYIFGSVFGVFRGSLDLKLGQPCASIAVQLWGGTTKGNEWLGKPVTTGTSLRLPRVLQCPLSSLLLLVWYITRIGTVQSHSWSKLDKMWVSCDCWIQGTKFTETRHLIIVQVTTNAVTQYPEVSAWLIHSEEEHPFVDSLTPSHPLDT